MLVLNVGKQNADKLGSNFSLFSVLGKVFDLKNYLKIDFFDEMFHFWDKGPSNGIIFNLTVLFAHILWLDDLWFYECISMFMSLLCFFTLCLLICLFCPIPVCFYFLSSFQCLFSNVGQKCLEFLRWVMERIVKELGQGKL